MINTSSCLDHDSVVEDFMHISPGVYVAGAVSVGKGSCLGIRSVLSNNVNICSGSKVGAGADVIKDITEPRRYVRVPVRKID